MAHGLIDPRQIRAARGLLGWTQSDLGKALGVDQRIVRFHERRLPNSQRKLDAIEAAFRTAGVIFTSTPVGVTLEGNTQRG